MLLPCNYKIESLLWHCLFCFEGCQRQYSYFEYNVGIYSSRKSSLDHCSLWKKLWVYTQIATNFSSMLKHPISVWAMPKWHSELSWYNRPLSIVETMQTYIWIILQNIMLSILALRALPSPTFQKYITLNQWTASLTPSRPRWRFGKPITKVHILDGY